MKVQLQAFLVLATAESISFTPKHPLNKRLDGPCSQSEHYRQEKNLFPSWKLNPDFSLIQFCRYTDSTLVTAMRISTLSGADGRPIYRILSSLPGLNTAGSTISGRLLAAIKNTPFRLSIPSISVNIWFTTRMLAPP